MAPSGAILFLFSLIFLCKKTGAKWVCFAGKYKKILWRLFYLTKKKIHNMLYHVWVYITGGFCDLFPVENTRNRSFLYA